MTTDVSELFPKDFVSDMIDLWGSALAQKLLNGLSTEVDTSLRVNVQKPMEASHFNTLRAVPWSKTGFYLKKRPQFTFDPLLHAGCYYVQESASMFIEQLYNALPEAPQRALDLCAAPGGKSSLLRSLLPDSSLLVSNEPINNRSMILAENMAKWGHPNTMICSAYGEDFAPLTDFFDLIVADVPCSGEGMFRKDLNAREEWKPDSPERCAEKQREIIASVWTALRPGGHLIYSTCTFNRKENEDNALWICEELGATPIDIDIDTNWNISTIDAHFPFYRFLPGRTQGEGFSCILLRKNGEGNTTEKKKKKKKSPLTVVPKEVKSWLRQPKEFVFVTPQPNYICALPASTAESILRIASQVHTLRMGIEMAEQKGNKWIPRIELALSPELLPTAFPRIDLPYEKALAYLRRETITIEAPKGYVVVCYKGHPLGFVNNLRSRANNLYPTEWRIRSQHNIPYHEIF